MKTVEKAIEIKVGIETILHYSSEPQIIHNIYTNKYYDSIKEALEEANYYNGIPKNLFPPINPKKQM